MTLALPRRTLLLVFAASIPAACIPSPGFSDELPTLSSPSFPNVISPTLAASCASPSSNTIQPFLQISTAMSFPDICRLVGLPSKNIGSGLYVFLYTLEDGSTITMGFGSLEEDAEVLYVRLMRPDGTEEALLE